MGIDIHMSIISKDNKLIDKEIYQGRDREWFDNLRGEGYAPEYDTLPAQYGFPEGITYKDKTTEDYKEYYYYDFRYMLVKDFIEWFQKTLPYLDAGYVTRYDEWLYETKHIYPRDRIQHYLSKDDNETNYIFREFVDEEDQSLWLYTYLTNRDDIPEDAYIIYFFDC